FGLRHGYAKSPNMISGRIREHLSVLLRPRGHVDAAGDHGGPAGLVAGAEAAAGVAVEVFVELDVIAPVLVVDEAFVFAEAGAATLLVAQEELGHAGGHFEGDALEVDHVS